MVLNSIICSRAAKIASMRRMFCSGGRAPGEVLDLVADLLVDQVAAGAGLQRDRVAVDRHDVHQAAVDDVHDPALLALLLAVLQLARGWPGRPGRLATCGRRRRAPRGRRASRALLRSVSAAVSSLAMSTRLAAAFMQAPSEVSPAGQGDHLAAPVAGLLVGGQRPGPADVALAGAGREAPPPTRRRRRCSTRKRVDLAARSAWPATTWRQRDRIVGSTSSTVGAHSSQTVLGVGSSIALSRVLPVRVVPSRSASSMTITW